MQSEVDSWCLERAGFLLLRRVFDDREIAGLIDALDDLKAGHGLRTRGGVYAVRNVDQSSPVVKAVARSERLLSIVRRSIGGSAFPTRATLFDKTPNANWLVPWHQDMTICVKERLDVAGYGPWSIKSGVQHVQPPVRVLERMLSIRVHLDDCDEDNGALRVLPGSHKLGRLTARQISDQQRLVAPVTCAAHAGDVLLMRPLILHASSSAATASHRRVIHIDYGSCELDGGLQWVTA